MLLGCGVGAEVSLQKRSWEFRTYLGEGKLQQTIVTIECHVGDALDALQPSFSENCDAPVGLIGPMTTLTCYGPAAIAFTSLLLFPYCDRCWLTARRPYRVKKKIVEEVICMNIYMSKER
jgi:hypothetical protein